MKSTDLDWIIQESVTCKSRRRRRRRRRGEEEEGKIISLEGELGMSLI